MNDASVLNLCPGRYFAAVGFLYGKHQRDCLGSVFRDGEGPWMVRYRFRYYVEGDPFSGKDDKRFYEAKCTSGVGTEDVACATLRAVFDALILQRFNKRLDWMQPRTDDPRKIFEMLKARPWFHYQAKPLH